jgi:hypothetical protein
MKENRSTCKKDYERNQFSNVDFSSTFQYAALRVLLAQQRGGDVALDGGADHADEGMEEIKKVESIETRSLLSANNTSRLRHDPICDEARDAALPQRLLGRAAGQLHVQAQIW